MLPDAGCVKTVAYELGYKQPSHFTRDFKQRFGVPPKVWLLADGGIAEVSLGELQSARGRERSCMETADLFANC